MTDAVPTEVDRRLCDIIRRHAVPMEVSPTSVAPKLHRMAGIRAVLFDVYGTLFISGSGDLGTTDVDSGPRAFPQALAAIGLRYTGTAADGARLLKDAIAVHHQRSHARGIEFPEVDLREVWSDVIGSLNAECRLHHPVEAAGGPVHTAVLALEYEVRTNPTWPMPSALACLHRLRDAGLLLGIVSNAQCFTRLLFPTQMSKSLEQLGICEGCCLWSYEHRQAKPGTFLLERARDAVGAASISAHEVLYVGNDRLKDIWPATLVGFRTALFAGDARSFRPRPDDPRITGVTADLVLTDLAQLPDCLCED